jgi:hypothetical protein
MHAQAKDCLLLDPLALGTEQRRCDGEYTLLHWTMQASQAGYRDSQRQSRQLLLLQLLQKRVCLAVLATEMVGAARLTKLLN